MLCDLRCKDPFTLIAAGLFAFLGLFPYDGRSANTPTGTTGDLGARLAEAIKKRSEMNLLRLIEEGADPNASVDGAPVLYLAAQENMPKAVAALLSKRAVVDASPLTIPGATPLGVAAQNGHLECARLLLAAGANVNGSRPSGPTPLHMAAQHNRREVAVLLLDAKADVDRRRTDGQTALGLAAEREFENVVALLIQRSANVNIPDAKGATPLHHAVRKANLSITQRLITAKADIEAIAANGIRPLHAAAYRRQPEIAALLLASGANPNARMRDGVTPMHVAAGGNAIAVARILLKSADLAARDSGGNTPLDIARKRNDASMIELLSSKSQ